MVLTYPVYLSNHPYILPLSRMMLMFFLTTIPPYHKNTPYIYRVESLQKFFLQHLFYLVAECRQKCPALRFSRCCMLVGCSI